VLSGIEADDRVVVNPPDSLTDGVSVRLAEPPPDKSQDKSKAT
jgi:hypothetical protein